MRKVTIRWNGEEYRVPSADNTEAGAYYTDSLSDALCTFCQMHPTAHTVRTKRVPSLTTDKDK